MCLVGASLLTLHLNSTLFAMINGLALSEYLPWLGGCEWISDPKIAIPPLYCNTYIYIYNIYNNIYIYIIMYTAYTTKLGEHK